MVVIPNNGRRLFSNNPADFLLIEAIKEKQQAHKDAHESYPKLTLDDYYSVPFFWCGRAPYHAETLAHLRLSKQSRWQMIPLPDDFIIDGEKRLPRESKDQYEAYLRYRDAGPARTLRSASPRRGSNAFSDLSRHMRWAERVAAWDAQIAVEAEHAMQQQIASQQRENIERRQTYLDNEHKIIESTVKRIHQMLSFPVDQQRVVTERYDDGREKTVTIVEPAKWTYASLAQIEGEVTKLARLHFGLSTSNASAKIETKAIDGGEPVQRQLTTADQAAHDYAAGKAEEAYFLALEEWKQQHASPERLTASITETAAD